MIAFAPRLFIFRQYGPFYWAFFILCVLSFDVFEPYLPLNTIVGLDVLIILQASIAVYSGRERLSVYIVFTILVAYLSSIFLNSIYAGSKITDILIASKSIIYLALLFLISSRPLIKPDTVYAIYQALLVTIFIQYSYTIFIEIGSFKARPSLFFENNFELLMLILFAAYSHSNFGLSTSSKLLLFVVILMSGSRSALLALIYFLVCLQRFKGFKSILLALFVFFIGFVSIFVMFYLRGGGVIDIQSIDRIYMINVLLEELKNRSLLENIFGPMVIEPLSVEACSKLISYSGLFSDVSKLKCYSVVLHGGNLRFIMDFGFMGSIFLYGFLVFLFLKNHHPVRYIIIYVGVIFIGGMSISGLNSVLVSFSLAIILMTRNIKRNHA